MNQSKSNRNNTTNYKPPAKNYKSYRQRTRERAFGRIGFKASSPTTDPSNIIHSDKLHKTKVSNQKEDKDQDVYSPQDTETWVNRDSKSSSIIRPSSPVSTDSDFSSDRCESPKDDSSDSDASLIAFHGSNSRLDLSEEELLSNHSGRSPLMNNRRIKLKLGKRVKLFQSVIDKEEEDERPSAISQNTTVQFHSQPTDIDDDLSTTSFDNFIIVQNSRISDSDFSSDESVYPKEDSLDEENYVSDVSLLSNDKSQDADVRLVQSGEEILSNNIDDRQELKIHGEDAQFNSLNRVSDENQSQRKFGDPPWLIDDQTTKSFIEVDQLKSLNEESDINLSATESTAGPTSEPLNKDTTKNQLSYHRNAQTTTFNINIHSGPTTKSCDLTVQLISLNNNTAEGQPSTICEEVGQMSFINQITKNGSSSKSCDVIINLNSLDNNSDDNQSSKSFEEVGKIDSLNRDTYSSPSTENCDLITEVISLNNITDASQSSKSCEEVKKIENLITYKRTDNSPSNRSYDANNQLIYLNNNTDESQSSESWEEFAGIEYVLTDADTYSNPLTESSGLINPEISLNDNTDESQSFKSFENAAEIEYPNTIENTNSSPSSECCEVILQLVSLNDNTDESQFCESWKEISDFEGVNTDENPCNSTLTESSLITPEIYLNNDYNVKSQSFKSFKKVAGEEYKNTVKKNNSSPSNVIIQFISLDNSDESQSFKNGINTDKNTDSSLLTNSRDLITPVISHNNNTDESQSSEGIENVPELEHPNVAEKSKISPSNVIIQFISLNNSDESQSPKSFDDVPEINCVNTDENAHRSLLSETSNLITGVNSLNNNTYESQSYNSFENVSEIECPNSVENTNSRPSNLIIQIISPDNKSDKSKSFKSFDDVPKIDPVNTDENSYSSRLTKCRDSITPVNSLNNNAVESQSSISFDNTAVKNTNSSPSNVIIQLISLINDSDEDQSIKRFDGINKTDCANTDSSPLTESSHLITPENSFNNNTDENQFYKSFENVAEVEYQNSVKNSNSSPSNIIIQFISQNNNSDECQSSENFEEVPKINCQNTDSSSLTENSDLINSVNSPNNITDDSQSFKIAEIENQNTNSTLSTDNSDVIIQLISLDNNMDESEVSKICEEVSYVDFLNESTETCSSITSCDVIIQLISLKIDSHEIQSCKSCEEGTEIDFLNRNTDCNPSNGSCDETTELISLNNNTDESLSSKSQGNVAHIESLNRNINSNRIESCLNDQKVDVNKSIETGENLEKGVNMDCNKSNMPTRSSTHVMNVNTWSSDSDFSQDNGNRPEKESSDNDVRFNVFDKSVHLETRLHLGKEEIVSQQDSKCTSGTESNSGNGKLKYFAKEADGKMSPRNIKSDSQGTFLETNIEERQSTLSRLGDAYFSPEDSTMFYPQIIESESNTFENGTEQFQYIIDDIEIVVSPSTKTMEITVLDNDESSSPTICEEVADSPYEHDIYAYSKEESPYKKTDSEESVLNNNKSPNVVKMLVKSVIEISSNNIDNRQETTINEKDAKLDSQNTVFIEIQSSISIGSAAQVMSLKNDSDNNQAKTSCQSISLNSVTHEIQTSKSFEGPNKSNSENKDDTRATTSCKEVTQSNSQIEDSDKSLMVTDSLAERGELKFVSLGIDPKDKKLSSTSCEINSQLKSLKLDNNEIKTTSSSDNSTQTTSPPRITDRSQSTNISEGATHVEYLIRDADGSQESANLENDPYLQALNRAMCEWQSSTSYKNGQSNLSNRDCEVSLPLTESVSTRGKLKLFSGDTNIASNSSCALTAKRNTEETCNESAVQIQPLNGEVTDSATNTNRDTTSQLEIVKCDNNEITMPHSKISIAPTFGSRETCSSIETPNEGAAQLKFLNKNTSKCQSSKSVNAISKLEVLIKSSDVGRSSTESWAGLRKYLSKDTCYKRPYAESWEIEEEMTNLKRRTDESIPTKISEAIAQLKSLYRNNDSQISGSSNGTDEFDATTSCKEDDQLKSLNKDSDENPFPESWTGLGKLKFFPWDTDEVGQTKSSEEVALPIEEHLEKSADMSQTTAESRAELGKSKYLNWDTYEDILAKSSEMSSQNRNSDESLSPISCDEANQLTPSNLENNVTKSSGETCLSWDTYNNKFVRISKDEDQMCFKIKENQSTKSSKGGTQKVSLTRLADESLSVLKCFGGHLESLNWDLTDESQLAQYHEENTPSSGNCLTTESDSMQHDLSSNSSSSESPFSSPKKKGLFVFDETLTSLYNLCFWESISNDPLTQWEEKEGENYKFKIRISGLASLLNPILNSAHRKKIYEQRFAE